MGNFFSEHASKEVIDAISKIEHRTYAELRVHIEDNCDSEDPIRRAVQVFEKLKMHKTKNKSGVLIYLATEDKKLAIIGDTGIDELVEPSYWNQIVQEVIKTILSKDVKEGILKGIELVGEKLVFHFPESSGQVNELPNEISYGKI